MPAITSTDFRRALGRFATGVTVVTVEREPGLVHGMTANSFTSVSLEPSLILICVDQRARLLPLVHEKRRFGVSVLTAQQRALSEYFARGEYDLSEERRLGVSFRWTENGIPLLDGTLAQLACNVIASYLAGDHTVFIAEVESAVIASGKPLLFWGGAYVRIAPES